VSVTAGQTTNVNPQFSPNTTSLVTANLVVSGLESGDTAVVTLTDNYNGNQYTFNKFNVVNGITVMKLLPGDKIALNLNANSKYLPINPTTYTVPNTSAGSVNVVFSVVPPVTKVFSPYKDVSINANWNTYVISSQVGQSSLQPLVPNLPTSIPTVTWAFATGECGQENWGGILGADLANANVASFVSAHKNYIISTGGAAGVFTCSTNQGMLNFVQRYMSANMLGIDFDIEGGQTSAQVNSLVSTLKYIQGVYPNLRISFTLATLAGTDGSNLNSTGQTVVNAANAMGLNYYLDLMVMDYGAPGSSVCVVENGACNMGKSAIQAAQNIVKQYGIPLSKIELTPMIGVNDVQGEYFTLNDATLVAQYVKTNGLAGLHYWSYDRDTQCAAGQTYASSLCTYILGVTINPWSFANAFYSGLNN
jgi:hypothetical protein